MSNSKTRTTELKHRKGRARLKARRRGPATRIASRSRVASNPR